MRKTSRPHQPLAKRIEAPRMTLRFRPKDEQVRIIYTDGPGSAMPEHKGKVFALIGPFEAHDDKMELQKMLLTLIRGWNIEQR